MKLTTKDIRIDTDSKLIEVFNPANITISELYAKLVHLWSLETSLIKHQFPLVAIGINKVLPDNGYTIDSKGIVWQ